MPTTLFVCRSLPLIVTVIANHEVIAEGGGPWRQWGSQESQTEDWSQAVEMHREAE